MGKRSAFDRMPRDFYPTPREAVLPLLPYLPQGARFAEPCAGDGALVAHLEAAGMVCVEALDIEPRTGGAYQADALLDWRPDVDADWIITNPPWDRSILHPMIYKFAGLRPTWLLFDADWVHTRQAAPMLPLLQSIVSVGRVKWIPGSKMTGKDNCAWHLFGAQKNGATQFFGRGGVYGSAA